MTTQKSPVLSVDTFVPPKSLSLGHVAPGSTVDTLLIDYPGNPYGPMPARALVAFDTETLAYAGAVRQLALLMFENDDPRRPIVVGLVQPPARESALRTLLVSPRAEGAEPAATTRVARVDGTHLVLEGYERITLKCGEASITLLKNGKVQLKGAYIETDSSGVNRIKGGTVKIN